RKQTVNFIHSGLAICDCVSGVDNNFLSKTPANGA
ncbi:MAG: hypothetical protein ACI9ZF_001379, partial [Bradyrhizobium sp.]